MRLLPGENASLRWLLVTPEVQGGARLRPVSPSMDASVLEGRARVTHTLSIVYKTLVGRGSWTMERMYFIYVYVLRLCSKISSAFPENMHNLPKTNQKRSAADDVCLLLLVLFGYRTWQEDGCKS